MAEEKNNEAPELKEQPTPEVKAPKADAKVETTADAPAQTDKPVTGKKATKVGSDKKKPGAAADAKGDEKPEDNAPPPAAAPSAAELLADENKDVKVIKAKGSKNVTSGIAHILATFNNTIVSITDMHGNVIGWASAGKAGFKGSRKSTAFAAQQVAQNAARQAMSHGMKEVEVRVKGPGSGRESAIRALQAIGFDITAIKDVTPVPHNGCRPKKKRRV